MILVTKHWFDIVIRVKGIVEEPEVKKMLLWFNSNFKGGVTADEFRWLVPTKSIYILLRTFFPKTATGVNLSDLVFRF